MMVCDSSAVSLLTHQYAWIIHIVVTSDSLHLCCKFTLCRSTFGIACCVPSVAIITVTWSQVSQAKTCCVERHLFRETAMLMTVYTATASLLTLATAACQGSTMLMA
jgi:hypothetical protein